MYFSHHFGHRIASTKWMYSWPQLMRRQRRSLAWTHRGGSEAKHPVAAIGSPGETQRLRLGRVAEDKVRTECAAQRRVPVDGEIELLLAAGQRRVGNAYLAAPLLPPSTSSTITVSNTARAGGADGTLLHRTDVLADGATIASMTTMHFRIHYDLPYILILKH